MREELIEKYNKAVPRYTSYPTVPHWQHEAPDQGTWLKHLNESYEQNPELSIYIHLPFCESLCTYCGCNKRITKNHQVESPYIISVLKEWKIYLSQLRKRPIIKEIHLGGGTPTFFSTENLRYLLDSIISDAEIAENHEFSFEAHPNSTSYEHLKVLYDLNFRRISIGVQDIAPEILKAINRNQSVEEVRQVTEWARSIGYTSINYDIIYGLPFQLESNIEELIKFIADQMPDRLAFYSYAHVPWKSRGQRAFTSADVPSGIFKNKLYTVGRKLLDESGYRQVGMDHFCLPGEALYQAYENQKMHRNFMGYSPHYTTCNIALGASAISDCWTAYVQNEKQVEKYQSIVDSGLLPISRGHILSKDQNIIRKCVLDLFCKDVFSWDSGSRVATILSPLLENLQPLANDNLVIYTSNSIQVTKLGRYFIRNICAAIDPIFQSSITTENQFSQAI